MVSVRLADDLDDELEDLVSRGVFRDKTDALHEAVRMLAQRYDSIPS